MHELAITQSMLDLVLNEANEHGAKKVKSIQIVIGAMQGVVPDCMETYFEMMAKDTIAEGARLDFELHAIQARCLDCGKEFEPEEYAWFCTECSSRNIEIVRGKELFVNNIEVE